jgi:glycosyltransferase involved in cell wall biosynthesis
MHLSIVILALNEAPNLRRLLPALHPVAEKLTEQYEVIVVDGGSMDGTPDVARELGARVVPQTEPGYGGALKAGFAAAAGEFVATMDADFSHRPWFLRRLWNMRDRAELVIASRYVAGGRAEMPLSRLLLSRVLNGFFARGLSLPYRDMSSGFRLYKRSALQEIKIASRDFEVLEEILIRLYAQGFQIVEVPFHYAPRQEGQSHAKIIKFGIRMLKTFFRMWRLRNSVDCCDYDWRAHGSLIPPQCYWQRKRFKILTRFARDATRTLDVGCGSSRILLNLPNAVGVDAQLNKIRYLRRFGQQALVGDIFQLPFKNEQFDCVVCSEVIERIRNDPSWCGELIRCLKPGGLLILGTPDYGGWSWPVIERVYRRIVLSAYANGHTTRYTRDSLVAQMARYGFAPQEIEFILGAEMIAAFRRSV